MGSHGQIVIPIGIRTRNRPAYLDVTLRSLLATSLPPGVPIVVLDDCSDDEISKAQLFSPSLIELPEPCRWPDCEEWEAYVGDLPDVTHVQGLRHRIRTWQPPAQRGVLGGIFWCIEEMMNFYATAPAVIVIEGDVVFHADWYRAVVRAYEHGVCAQGPNGLGLGLLSAYNRKPGKPGDPESPLEWCALHRKENGNWNCSSGLGGVMYLVGRRLYESARPDFRAQYNPQARSGDTALQAVCARAGMSIAATPVSYIQHIGVESSAWPAKGWRYARRFLKPFVLLSELPEDLP